MKRGLTTGGIALLAFAAGSTVSFFTLPIWIVALIGWVNGGPRTDWLGFAGGLIGNLVTAFVAAIAIYFGWQGIKRQMRASMISREEDRIERDLPGLQDLAAALENLNYLLELVGNEPDLVIKILTDQGYRDDGFTAPIDLIRSKLPRVDDRHRRYFADILRAMGTSSWVAQVALRGDLNKTLQQKAAYDRGLAEFRTAIAQLSDFQSLIEARIARYELQLPKFRRELEQYFGE
ncbi:hypothetical protein [Tardiphaga sp. 813_E8_N1_3]|uniref:hypothetical protein n=1 Tax=Tardiphaga sp. 813_E8_N1_3 TaxID=3240760 RepID=UPI003F29E12B